MTRRSFGAHALRLAKGLACALGLAGCGESTQETTAELGHSPASRLTECPELDTSICDIGTPECQRRMWDIARCLRGGAEEAMPPISVMTPTAYAAELRAELPAQPSTEVKSYETALAMLGLMPPGALESDAYVAEQLSWLGGVYRPEKGDIVVLDRTSQPQPRTIIGEGLYAQSLEWHSLSPTLVHEFVHALQDREIGLNDFSEAHSSSSDASWAAQAVIEGEARWLDVRYSAATLGLDPEKVDWQSYFENSIERSSREQLVAGKTPLQSLRRTLVYFWGGRFVSEAWQKRKHAGVVELQLDPPEHALTVMGGHTPELPAASFAGLAPGAEWELVGDDELGSLGVLAAMSSAGGMSAVPDFDAALEIALAWRGDELKVFTSRSESGGSPTDAGTPSGSHVLVAWQIEFAQEASANAFLERQRQRGEFTRSSSLLTRTGTRVLVLAATRAVDWGFADTG
ncbi:MAG TPA: hypothetical protein VFQ61_18475 [Polyangiaceae bacterium]|nr:hypothetical protein [Polyangiaceae bacterium]